ncbi:MAG TPA: sialidase family protein [Candidatus Binatia bacterium]|nr:sialidase family protein [Candidatus Binatia bacterium]
MNSSFTRTFAPIAVGTFLCLVLAACTADLIAPDSRSNAVTLSFGPEQRLGHNEKNPAAPFLRYSADGSLFAVWTEDHDTPWPQGNQAATSHQHKSGDRAPSPMRNALLSWSTDSGKTWSSPGRVNSVVEAVQGEENGPKVAFVDKKAYVVWSIPGAKGDKTRANIRFAMDDGKGGFTAAQTLNEVKDAARFPSIEATPEGNLLVAWIDRRIDNPKPRQLYLMKLSPNGKLLTKNYQVGEGLCECCKLGIAFADGGKTVYMVDREVDGNKIRNHVLRKSTDGAASFGAPVEISNDGWQVPSCPHSGPSIGRDSRGQLHVTWFTLGRSEREAGIYYSVSKDDGKNFAPRQLIQANTAPETLYATLAVGDDDRVYLAWSNLDSGGKAQIFMRTLGPNGRAWSPIQQISHAKGNAGRPVLALMKNQLQVAWTETDGEDSRVVLRNATVGK